ncbi:MAG TPA: ABC transporter permease subunit [Caulobacteraceae bacterium]|nr:ABC transporter permease subunit [Caulobacteraceae bacterium]
MSEPVLRRAHPALRAPFNVWDLVALALILGVFIAMSHGARETFAPLKSLATQPISLDPHRLPEYALRTSLRMVAGMVASLVFTFGYAALAAKSRHAEMVLIPLLDILQSVPVLAFLSITLVWLMALAPGSVLGAEFASIFTVFTAQAWNMTFSFYQSLKTIPADLEEAAKAFGLTPWQKFWRLEAPFGAPALIWNMMMSMAGGWFFVTASEAFTVGATNVNLPGVGSYIAAANDKQDYVAIGWAVLTMALTILLFDQLFFRPLVAWSEKFHVELTASSDPPQSWVLDLLRRTRLMARVGRPIGEAVRWLASLRIKTPPLPRRLALSERGQRTFDVIWISVILVLVIFAARQIFKFVAHTLTWADLLHAVELGFFTLARVVVLIALASLVWTPVAVWIGLRPKIAERVQPIAQFLAAFPVNLLYGLVVSGIIAGGLDPNIFLSPLMILGTQWYILFNVIAGASAYPTDLKQAAASFGVKGWQWWRNVMGPGILPYFVTGALTASGGAWNAAIVSEVASWGDKHLRAAGLGAYIADASTAGDMPRVVMGVAVMSVFVVALNRTVWRPLYGIAERRFRFD